MAREEEEGRAGGPAAGPAGPPSPSPSGLAPAPSLPAEEAPGGEAPPVPLLECPLCLEVQPPSAFPAPGGCCGGRACGGCLGRYLREAIRGSRVPVPCPLCPAPLGPDDVRRLLRLLSADEAEALRQRYEAFLLRRALAAEPGARWCPAPDCSFAVLAEGFAACPRLVCGRPRCGAAFCFLCRQPWPKDGRPCCPREAPQPPTEPHGAGKEKDGAGRGKACESIRRCPRCRAPIAKAEDGGCNRMSCALCGCLFCWLCGREISELHFLSPSGCTFWGRKPWSRRRRRLWQLGLALGAPLLVSLAAGLALPALALGLPVYLGRKVLRSQGSGCQRCLSAGGSALLALLLSPLFSALAVGLGVPLALAYLYGAVLLSLRRQPRAGRGRGARGARGGGGRGSPGGAGPKGIQLLTGLNPPKAPRPTPSGGRRRGEKGAPWEPEGACLSGAPAAEPRKGLQEPQGLAIAAAIASNTSRSPAESPAKASPEEEGDGGSLDGGGGPSE